MYTDLQWVAKEYLRRCEEGAWKKEDDEYAVSCWNLERVIDAELSGQRPPKQDISLDDLLREFENTDKQDKSIWQSIASYWSSIEIEDNSDEEEE